MFEAYGSEVPCVFVVPVSDTDFRSILPRFATCRLSYLSGLVARIAHIFCACFALLFLVGFFFASLHVLARGVDWQDSIPLMLRAVFHILPDWWAARGHML